MAILILKWTSGMEQLFVLANAAADVLAQRLADSKQRIVLAESCTAGMAAAVLGGCPGISAWFCGSAVTYRAATKCRWLGVDQELIEQFSAESSDTAQAMALAALTKTPEADLAAAITGHLGPQAPVAIDGKVFMTVAFRESGEVIPFELQLKQTERRKRQLEAAVYLLRFADQALLQAA